VLPEIRGAVRFEHVSFGYDPAKPVLHDVNFDAQAGQTIALVGQTGCGKSTVISLICRFYQPQQGRILIDGYDLRKIQGESLHRQTGIVSQNNFLFTGTVMDNIRYTRPDATDQQVYDAARQLDCYDILSRLKDGFQTDVGERGGSLSLGQRQLVCFCRAFLANPRILILDEATSAIDTQTELLIQNALERLVENRTTFIVAHRLSTIIGAHQVLVLDQGRIVEHGNHQSLLERNGQYARLYYEFTHGHDIKPHLAP
jgi:ATP-binding cassette subfamily B protein